MATSVLGKRLRDVAVSSDGTATAKEAAITSTRSKRRITLNEPNDENENPFATPYHESGDGDERPTKKVRSSGRSVPAKHGAPESRVTASPSRIGSHYGVRKIPVEVHDASKTNSLTSTPKTPRHRDALSKKVAVTPRHRALVGSSPHTPRTPRTPSTPATTAIYNKARQLFSRCSNPGRLSGREEETAELSAFIRTRIESTSGGCLYISGPPGTGKSAVVEDVIRQQAAAGHVKVSVVNCMSVRTTKDLSQKLFEDFGLPGDDAKVQDLKTCFVPGKGRGAKPKDGMRYLVILDEVDRLVELDLALLYSLFEWALHNASRLVLVGIANALDLTDRLLPRLKARGLRPELLPFMPYTAAQIADILSAKLKSLSEDESPAIPFLHPAAIQFCAKKVAGQTGDLRKAFDICRRAIDLVEQETREKEALPRSPSKTPLMENINLSSPPSSRAPTVYTLATAPKATIAHMARVTSQAFSNGATQRLSTLNLQQKAVLCALAALELRKREAPQVQRTLFSTPSSKHAPTAPSIKQLFEAYSHLCTRGSLFHPLSNLEFRDVVSGLETLSLLTAADGKAGTFAFSATPSRTPGRKGKNAGMPAMGDERRVASVVGLKELDAALEGPGAELLRDMLDGKALD